MGKRWSPAEWMPLSDHAVQTETHTGVNIRGILQARTEWGYHFLLQGIVPTQGSNPGLFCPYTAGRFFSTSTTGKRLPLDPNRTHWKAFHQAP